MKNKIFQFVFSLLAACSIVIISSLSSNAQDREVVELEIRQYVEEKGLNAKVPADIASLVRGDLNKDGKEDVVIQYYVQIGYPGNLTNTYLATFLNKDDKLAFTSEIDAAVVPSKIENGLLICDKYGEGAKKFDKVETIKYKLVKQELVEVKAKK